MNEGMNTTNEKQKDSKKEERKKIYKKISGLAATPVVISDALLRRVRNSLEIWRKALEKQAVSLGKKPKPNQTQSVGPQGAPEEKTEGPRRSPGARGERFCSLGG